MSLNYPAVTCVDVVAIKLAVLTDNMLIYGMQTVYFAEKMLHFTFTNVLTSWIFCFYKYKCMKITKK